MQTLNRTSPTKSGRVSSKELLEEIGDEAPLPDFPLAEGIGAEDGPAENNPPPLFLLDRLQAQLRPSGEFRLLDQRLSR